MIANVLNYRLLSQPELHDTVIKNRQRLKWAAGIKKVEDGGYAWEILQSILDYDEAHGKLPNRRALAEFVETSNDFFIAHRASWIREELRAFPDSVVQGDLDTYTDPDVLVAEVVKEARQQFHLYIAARYRGIVVQGPTQTKGRKDEEPSGIDAAMADMRKWWSRDLNEQATELAGIWQDNTEAIKQRLADYSAAQAEGRILLGLDRVDKTFVIRKGKALFLIGSSGDGKSTLLHSLVYNMARAGNNILYVSLEFEPQEVWEFLAFIHTHQFRDRLFLPSQNTWQMAKATDEDRKNMELVLDDIQQRTTVPGLIDVQKFFTWDEVEEYFEAHNEKNKYTVVVVDYIYKMNVATNSKYPGDIPKAKDAMISKAISWCHKKATFALISPHQVNREGHKAAKKEGSSGYDLDSLFASSAVQQDADLVVSVFSGEDQRDHGIMSLKCLKHRGTEPFAQHDLKLDGRTKYVRDADDVRAEDSIKNKQEMQKLWAEQQEKERIACEKAGREFIPTALGEAKEVMVAIPDAEAL